MGRFCVPWEREEKSEVKSGRLIGSHESEGTPTSFSWFPGFPIHFFSRAFSNGLAEKMNLFRNHEETRRSFSCFPGLLIQFLRDACGLPRFPLVGMRSR